MIYILYLKCDNNFAISKDFLHYYPKEVKQKINKYKFAKDRNLALGGKYLLAKGLKLFDIDLKKLNSFTEGEFGKPSIDAPIEFNISHSEEYVVCAISDEGEIGIDIEKIHDIDPDEFDNVFTKEEIENIKKSNDKNYEFFKLWTIKEAAMKACGKGFSQDPKGILILDEKTLNIAESRYYFHKIEINRSDYISYLVMKNLDTKIIYKYVD
jgi:4'-phosphopantetheinyl transferase